MNEALWTMPCVIRIASAVFVAVWNPVAKLYGQNDEKVVVVNHADSLVGREIGGERARELIGHVKFTQGSVVVSCEKAIQYLTTNKLSLEGEVELSDSTMRMVSSRGMYYGDTKTAEAFERVMVEDRSTTLTADYAKYFVKEKKAYFKGNVTVEDSGSVLTARELTYFRTDQHSTAIGDVKITNARDGMTIFGDHFENFRQRKYSRMMEHPKVIQVDTTSSGSPDTLIVTSRLMESYQDSLGRLVATDSVKMVRNQFAAEAGASILYVKLESVVLRRSPFIWYGVEKSQDNQVSGDSIFIKLAKRKLQTMYVRGSAFAISRADTQFANRFDQMSGQELVMHFMANKIQRIDVDKTATSLYYLFDGRNPNGLNKTSGDHVTILFSDGKIDKLKVIAGPEGQYYPEKMIRGKESEYNLPGFNWRENHPRRKATSIIENQAGNAAHN